MSDREGAPGGERISAEEAYSDYRRRLADGEDPSFEELCAEHPSLAHALRLLHDAGGEEGEPEDMEPFSDDVTAAFNQDLPDAAGDDEGQTLPGEEEVAAAFAAKPLYTAAGDQRFSVRRVLARGVMSVVLEVYDQVLDRTLAMKVMVPESPRKVANEGHMSSGISREERFLREAHLLGRLEHPGILPVFQLGTDPEGHRFFTMPVVHGDNLSTIFTLSRQMRDGWNQRRALLVMLQICRTLAYVHSRGIIHRDLKPDNIMVGAFGETYVMDWGLAKEERLLGDRVPGLRPTSLEDAANPMVVYPHGPTIDGIVLGTPPYIAPEQATGDLEAIDARSDVYSVGAMLYELLTGGPPYLAPGEAPTTRETLNRIEAGPPQPIHEADPQIPPELAAICEKAMARRKDDRYADLQHCADDLQAFLEDRVVHAYETGALAELRKWTRRNRLPAFLMGAVLFVVIAGLGATVITQSRARVVERGAAELAKTYEERARKEELEKVLALAELHRRTDHLELLSLEDRVTSERMEALPDPERLKAWLDDADELLARLPHHRNALQEMRRSGESFYIARPSDCPSYHPLTPLIDELTERSRVIRRTEFLKRSGLQQIPGYEQNKAILEARSASANNRIEVLTQLRNRVHRKIQEFGHSVYHEDGPQHAHDLQARLVAGLELLTARDPVPGAYVRIKDLHDRLSRSRPGLSWAETMEAIADEAKCPFYWGIRIVVQKNLVPLGPDPATGLWEFAHAPSGTIPHRTSDGRLGIAEESGIVLFLIPGSMPPVGHAGPTYPGVVLPAKRDRIIPFFLSKYEVTQGQWKRMTGENPSHFGVGVSVGGRDHTLLHPVEGLSHVDVQEVLQVFDLRFPASWQWEHALRAGRPLDVIFGGAEQSLALHANLRNHDDYILHAPVGSFRPNAFGLHDMLGNVWEFCIERVLTDEYIPGDPLTRSGYGRMVLDNTLIRGGSYMTRAEAADPRHRRVIPCCMKAASLGIRPVRTVERE